MTFRRHPRSVELGAWFDGEDSAGAGPHITRCGRCQRRVAEMARVRAWIRAQPFFSMGDDRPAARSSLHRWGQVAVPTALLMLFLLVTPHDERRPTTAPDAGPDRQLQARAERPADSGAPGQVAGPVSPPPPAGGRSDGRVASSPAASGRPVPPLRLGLVVPTTGVLAGEGAEVRAVVEGRVAVANSGGGVGGLPVELLVVAAEDAAGVATLSRKVTAVVGGFGAPPPASVPWLLPADPQISGPNVVATEVPPLLAGQQLGTALGREGLDGPVGVVVGAGSEAGLAAGLRSRVATTTVEWRPGSGCGAEIAALRRAGAVALAVAGPPEVAARCLRAAGRSSWRPRFGTLVAPSAAYAHVEALAEAGGARTVLALPWPTSPAPGAARFRATTRSRSYRALVSLAATELAIDVARQQGTISLPGMATATWRSDLLDLVGTSSRPRLSVAAPQAWLPGPPVERLEGPLSPVRPLPVLPG